MTLLLDSIKAMVQGRFWYYRHARRKDGRQPAKEFFEGLSTKEWATFQYLLRMVANERAYHNKQKFRKLKGYSNIWRFRSDDLRLLCYQSGDCYVLTNGFRKDQNKTNPKYIKLAIKIKNEDMQRRK